MNKRIAKKILNSDNYFDIWMNDKGCELFIPRGGKHYELVRQAFLKLHLDWEEFIYEIIGIATSNVAINEEENDLEI